MAGALAKEDLWGTWFWLERAIAGRPNDARVGCGATKLPSFVALIVETAAKAQPIMAAAVSGRQPKEPPLAVFEGCNIEGGLRQC
mmetsp:Transcript_53504/g.100304  ORF Transcript_53504/g.100304 Transcript_53504/m.100304 type:complete len:85 (-) Transcript_53504:3-257(-)